MIAPLRSDTGEPETSLVHGCAPLNSSAPPACWDVDNVLDASARDDELWTAWPPQPAHASTAALENAKMARTRGRPMRPTLMTAGVCRIRCFPTRWSLLRMSRS